MLHDSILTLKGIDFMKNKLFKIIVVSVCLALVISCATLFAGAYIEKLNAYKNLDDEQMDEKLSKLSVPKIFDEVDALSNEGVEYPELIDFAFALLKKIDNIPESLLINTIINKNLSANLRMLCVELLEQKLENTNGAIKLGEKNTAKLETLVLDESENSSVRFRLIETLPRNESTAKILEVVAFDKEGEVAYRALQFLNFFAPEYARPIAEGFIESGENIETGIDIINYQMIHSDDNAEKDAWVAYLVDLLEKSKNESKKEETDTASLKYFLINSLSALRYSKALYEIINSEYVDNEYKSYCIGDPKSAIPVFLEILENAPTDYDIEMIMKAIDINPLDTFELVAPLEVAIENSEKNYDISNLIERVNKAIAAEYNERSALYASDELLQAYK